MFFGKKRRGKNCLEKISAITKCDCEAVPEDITPDGLMRMYFRELENGRASGYTPVIIVADDVFYELIKDRFDEAGGAEEYNRSLLSADTSGGEEVLRRRYENSVFFDDGEEMPDEPMEAFINISKDDLSDGETLLLVRVPTAEPWKIFAWIPFGGWNECPTDGEIMSVVRYWFDKYGAVPALLTRDTMQLYAADPVTDAAFAYELAKEQFSFSCDVVNQGVGSIDALARTILNSNVWFFWWD